VSRLCIADLPYALVQEDILMWGGFGGREDRPQQVKSAWHLAAEFMSNFTLTVGLISIASPDLFYLLSA